MQRQRHTQDDPMQGVLPRLPVLAPGATAAPAGTVRVLAGADAEDMALAGRTVRDARVLAQAILGIDPQAMATLDGEHVGEDHLLGEGQELEFVKHAGSKGAAPADAEARAPGPVIELAGDRARWRRDGEVLGEIAVEELVTRMIGASADARCWRLLPRSTRLMVTRANGQVVGVVIEMPPGPRQVRWIAADSPLPSGPEARYITRRLSFPWVVLLVVFRNGDVTGAQQAFYRRAPLAGLDDPLYLTNLLNVARSNSQVSWLCLQNIVRRLGGMTWDQRVKEVIDHFWQAAFNWSADGPSHAGYYATGGKIDRRLETVETWEAATRANPYFALEVPWKRAPQTLGACMESLLAMIVPYSAVTSTEQLVTLMQRKSR